MDKNLSKTFVNIHWKKKDNIALFLIIFIGLIFTFIGYFYIPFYNIFFSTSLGLFFGGLILSIISTFLAQMESNITGAGELDAEMDLDVDADVDVDIDADVDVDVDADVDIDVDADVDIDVDIDYDTGVEIEIEGVEVDAEVDLEAGVEIDSDVDINTDIGAEPDADIVSTVTPAPIMLLLSTFFLIFGISGIVLYYTVNEALRFLILFITPTIAYITTKIINFGWKKIAKSRYYQITSTKNLIGTKGEVLLPIDERGGIIRVPSNTPLKFERLHVKPLMSESNFERGDVVYICDVKNGYLLVDRSKKLIKGRR